MAALKYWDAASGTWKLLPQVAPSAAYTHVQGTPAATWNVVHNLGFHPNVAPVDSVDRAFIADVTYIDNNSLTITLAAATSGKAYLS